MPAMVIDRRTFLTGGAAVLAASPVLAQSQIRSTSARSTFAAACVDADGAHAVAVFGHEGEGLRLTPLPARGHDIALRPGTREAIVFARRPGRFAVAFDLDGRTPPKQFDSEDGRHFFGHGIFSSDGRLLFSSENDIAGSRGVLGIRDVGAGYKPIGSFATGGMGPHDVALLSDNRTIVVANGGIDTDPNGRDPIDLSSMRPSLSYVDLVTGDLLEQVELESDLHELSIRHLGVGVNDTVVFGCQWEGSKTNHPPLVGRHRRGGKASFVEIEPAALRRLRHYVGSVAVDRSGTIAAASAPKGGLAVYVDVATGRYLGVTEIADVCGLAPAEAACELILTSGTGLIRTEHADMARIAITQADVTAPVSWDNHIASLLIGA